MNKYTNVTYDNIYLVIEELYAELCDHPEIGQHFLGVDIDKLICLQTQFVSRSLGLNIAYTGRPMHRAHLPLKITKFQYGEVSKVFGRLFIKHGFSLDVVDKVQGLLFSLENSIVSSKYSFLDSLMKPFYFVLNYFENILRSRGAID